MPVTTPFLSQPATVSELIWGCDDKVSDLGRSPSRARTKQCGERRERGVLRTRATEDPAGRRFAAGRVSDGTRTRDRLDHNQELYRLSYAHRVAGPARRGRATFGI